MPPKNPGDISTFFPYKYYPISICDFDNIILSVAKYHRSLDKESYILLRQLYSGLLTRGFIDKYLLLHFTYDGDGSIVPISIPILGYRHMIMNNMDLPPEGDDRRLNSLYEMRKRIHRIQLLHAIQGTGLSCILRYGCDFESVMVSMINITNNSIETVKKSKVQKMNLYRTVYSMIFPDKHVYQKVD